LGINRIAWGAKLLLMGVLAHPAWFVSFHVTYLMHSAQSAVSVQMVALTCLQLPTHSLPPIDSIRDIAETEKRSKIDFDESINCVTQ